MVCTNERFKDNSPISPVTPMVVKNSSARESICLFTEVLDAKNKTAVRQVGAEKSKRKAIRPGKILCLSIPNRKEQT